MALQGTKLTCLQEGGVNETASTRCFSLIDKTNPHHDSGWGEDGVDAPAISVLSCKREEGVASRSDHGRGFVQLPTNRIFS